MSLIFGDTTDSLKNRQVFLEGLGIDYRNLVCAKQIHSNRVVYVGLEARGSGAFSYDTAIADIDALITDKKDVPLAIFTADCLSIFLYAPCVPAIGLVHAGWRSSRENIIAKTVQLMQREFNIQPSRLLVTFGPAIRDCCYDVGQEFNNFFSVGRIKRDKRYYVDLVKVNRKQLLDLGMKESDIFDCKICTSCRNKDFFSYRKEGNTCGRMMSVIMLK